MTGRVKIFTYGCQMNDLDSTKLYSLLRTEGWEPTEHTAEADLLILNTCSVRQKAFEKAMSNLGRLRENKQENPGLIIAMAGCAAQQEGGRIIERYPHVDLVIGTHQLHRITELVERVRAEGHPLAETEFGDAIPCMDIMPAREFVQPEHRAYVSIMQGCNNFCTYCIVPYVRGREISRDHELILDEVREHARRGVREIFLLGQNVNSFAGGMSFPDLLRRIHDIEGISRIRFTTSHPKDMSPELIRCYAELPKLCSWLHLPFQSGSNNVLQAMNRRYTREHYLELIAGLKDARPDLALTSDVIVGFPGETLEDFEATLDVIRTVRYDNLYSFNYSVRPDTRAAEFDDDVPREEKSRRLSELQTLQREISAEISAARVGRTFDVLVDGVGTRHEGQIHGRTPQGAIVNFTGDASLVGRTVPVLVTRANPNSLLGEAV